MRLAAAVFVMLGSSLVAHAEDVDPQVAALVGRVDTVAAEVAKVRGLPLKTKVAHEVIDREALKQRLAKMATEDNGTQKTRLEGWALERWGSLPAGTDYLALALGVLDDQIAGFYDPKTKAMTFISSAVKGDASWGEMVLAHELDHALQDQSFDLAKFEKSDGGDATNDDALLARHALVEGDGIAIMIEVLLVRQGSPLPWSNPAVAGLIKSSMAEQPGGNDSLSNAPLVVREGMLFPYRDGFSFVAALRRHQPWSAVDGAFKRPPRSTEQILHPDKYAADEIPTVVKIDATVPGYTKVHDTVWGEFGFASFLKTHGVEASLADVAAAGWGGDRVVLLSKTAASDEHGKPEQMIGLARSEWDTEPDAIEAVESIARALDDAVVGATITHDGTKTSWLALDGTSAWVERRGTSVAFGIGAPVYATAKLQAALWAQSTAKPGKK